MAVCANCGEENPEGARFCNACGAPLVVAERPAEVRKTVTILFCDVTGSTAMGEKLDPESLRKVMTRYFDEMSRVIESHGGTVEKFIGDAVMAVFGIPVLHEDDALRAVRAAEEMRATLELLNAELERDWGVRIQTRTGVNTGEVVAGTGNQQMATGDAVNTAARLEQHAQPGEILLGEQTHRLVRHRIVAEEAPALSAKGKAEPLTAFRLIRTLEVTSDAGRRLDSPLVGRNNELALAEQAFERAVREQSCSLFTVFGAAGVGKSRLTQEVIHAVETRATVSRGRCLPYGRGITFWPVVEMIQAMAGLTENDDPADARKAIRKLFVEEEDADLIVEHVLQVMSLGEGEAHAQETFWGVRKLFESLARRAPLVLIFDDIHWAEPVLLDLIEHVADLSRDVSMLLMCIARPELLERRPGWGGGKMNASSILLEPLRADESELLMENLLGGATLPPEVRTRIADAAEGNPLFVEEMVSMLIDDGLLSRRNGEWEMSGEMASVSIPPTIQALLAARLDRLDADERVVIQAASVVGKEFGVADVESIVPELVSTRTRSIVTVLVRKELVRPDRSGSSEAFRFRHILIRDAAYNAISKQERVALHQRFADWLEDHYADRLPEFEEIIGYHLEQAFGYRSSLGPLDDAALALSHRAGAHLASAARRAATRGDSPGAINLLERALALLPDEWEQRAEPLLRLGEELYEAGELERSIEVHRSTEDAARAAGDGRSEWLAKVMHTTVAYTHFPIETTDVRGIARDSIRTFEELGDTQGLARAWNLMAWTHNAIGEHRHMLEAALRANTYAREAGSELLELRVRPMVGSAMFWGPTPTSEALAQIEGDRQRGVRSTVLRAVFLGGYGMFLALAGRVEEGREMLKEGIKLHEDLGQRMLATSLRGFARGNAEVAAEDWPAAIREIKASLEGLQAAGDKAAVSTLAGMLALVLYENGDYDEAYRYTELSDEFGADDDFATQLMWRAARAEVEAVRGHEAQAIEYANDSVRIAESTEALMWHCDAYMARGEVFRLLGRNEEAAIDFQRCVELYEQKEAPLHAGRARRKLAEVTA